MAKKKDMDTEHDKEKMIAKIKRDYLEEKLSKVEYDMWMAVYRQEQECGKKSKKLRSKK